MAFNFNFRHAQDEKEIRKLEKFLLLQPLGYLNYEDWVSRVREELLAEYKRSILFFSDGYLVGNLVFQPHKQFPRIREAKNERVHPKLQGRYCGAFMFKQMEAESPEDYDAIICDTRSDQIGVMSMLKSLGYEELLRVPLYDKNVEDVVMIKRFEKTPEGIFSPIKRTLISSTA